MKSKYTRLSVCFLLVIFVLTGCRSSKTDTIRHDSSKKEEIKMPDSGEYIPGEDGCNTCLLDQVETAVVPDGEGYYFNNNGSLCYYDGKTDKTVYVCSKPDCRHVMYDDSCDAYIAGAINMLYYYKNNLYSVSRDNDSSKGTTGLVLTRISADASEREELYCFIHCLDSESVTFSCYVHRGYLYYSVANSDAEKKKKVRLYRRALKKDAPEEAVYETEGYYTGIDRITAYGNYLYLEETGFRKPGEEENYSELLKYNIHTREVETLTEDQYGMCVKVKNHLYTMDKDRKMIIRFSEDGKDKKELYPVEDLKDTYLKTDGTYLYLYTRKCIQKEEDSVISGTVQVIDTEGNPVDTLKDTDAFVGGDDTFLFFKKTEEEYSEESGQEESVEHMYYYKKSDLGSGDYSLRKEMKPE